MCFICVLDYTQLTTTFYINKEAQNFYYTAEGPSKLLASDEHITNFKSAQLAVNEFRASNVCGKGQIAQRNAVPNVFSTRRK